ncbi:hypothetical protein ACHGLA_32400 [Streptomyces sp. YH02]
MAGCLRQTWRTRPWAIAVAAERLRAEAEPPVPFSPGAWLAALAVRLRG